MFNFKILKYSLSQNYISSVLYFFPIAIIIGNSAINILNFILLICFFFLFLKNKKLFNNYIKYFKYLIILSVIFFLNIFFSIDKFNSIISYFGFLGHFLIMISILYCLDTNIKFSNFFFKILLIVILLTGLDTLYQYFSGIDMFGFKIDEGHGRRLSGPFGDEYIVGSYLSKFFFLSLLYFKENEFKYLKLFLICFFMIIIILTNERAATIMFLAAIILYLTFNNEFSLKQKFLQFSVLLTIIISLFSIDNNLKKHFIDRTFDQIRITKSDQKKHENFLDSQWGAHYLTSIEIFKNHKLIGSGLKTFRVECSSKNYATIKTIAKEERCSTHPHNIYLEVLSEVGLIGIITFAYVVLVLCFKIVKNFIKKYRFSYQELLIGISFFILFNPFQTTGAFFSTWNGSFYWIIIPFILRLDKMNTS